MEHPVVHSCYLGLDISPEQLIPEHFFMHILEGTIVGYDGGRQYRYEAGDTFIARKNHLIRYTKIRKKEVFNRIVIAFDETFLRSFLERNPHFSGVSDQEESLLTVRGSGRIEDFLQSLQPYYEGDQMVDNGLAQLKREELLKILLEEDPRLADMFFNFRDPEKADMQALMNRNFRFNIPLERFAFLSGRSLSAFKREFRHLFHTTPGAWLTKRRLEEAHFQIRHANRSPSDVYLDVGFENLSHFSFAFKKQFGKSPQAVVKER